jgi:hypothetical protein
VNWFRRAAAIPKLPTGATHRQRAGPYIVKQLIPEILAMRVDRRGIYARPRAVAVPFAFILSRPLVVALLLGAALALFLPRVWGADACSQGTAAPNGQCAKTPKGVAKKTAAPTVAAAAVPVPEPSWKSVLDPLPAGGWTFISDGPAENPSVVYASTHSVAHIGNVTTAWMRWEFSHPQADVYPLHYLSAVTRQELDCDLHSYRRSAVIYYTRNNLQEKGPAFTAQNDDTNWKQAIPGSEPDAMLNWACTPPAAEHHARAVAKADTHAHAAPESSEPAAAPLTNGTNLHTLQ